MKTTKYTITIRVETEEGDGKYAMRTTDEFDGEVTTTEKSMVPDQIHRLAIEISEKFKMAETSLPSPGMVIEGIPGALS